MKSKWTHSGNLIIAGFALCVVLMSALVYVAIKNPSEMVTDNYYEKELVFQDRINASKNADAYDSLFRVTKTGSDVRVSIPAVLSEKLEKGQIEFYCPSGAENDKKEALAKSGSGIYSFNTSGWAKKNYVSKISFVSGGVSYYKELPVSL